MTRTARKSKKNDEESSGLPDARELWAPFSLPPVRLETPVSWHPILADWTLQSSRIRWEPRLDGRVLARPRESHSRLPVSPGSTREVGAGAPAPRARYLKVVSK